MHSRGGCDLQDLIDCEVVLQKDNLLIGRVLDVYDGTGKAINAVALKLLVA